MEKLKLILAEIVEVQVSKNLIVIVQVTKKIVLESAEVKVK